MSPFIYTTTNKYNSYILLRAICFMISCCYDENPTWVDMSDENVQSRRVQILNSDTTNEFALHYNMRHWNSRQSVNDSSFRHHM